jgi:hypothetical protein
MQPPSRSCFPTGANDDAAFLATPLPEGGGFLRHARLQMLGHPGFRIWRGICDRPISHFRAPD